MTKTRGSVLSIAIALSLGACSETPDTSCEEADCIDASPGHDDAGTTRDAGDPNTRADADAPSDAGPPDAGQRPPTVTGITLGAALLEMPGYGSMPDNVLAPVQLLHAHWLTSGRFVVTAAACHQRRENRGFWVFGEDGSAQGESHTCLDSLAEGEDKEDLQLWAHQWNSGNAVFAIVDGTHVVMGGEHGASRAYPPKLYELGATPSPRMASRAYGLRVDALAVSTPPTDYNAEEAPRFVGYAVVGERLVARVTDAGGGGGQVRVYALPGLTELARVTTDVEPITNVNGFVLGRTRTGGTWASGVYQLGADNALTLLHALPEAVIPLNGSIVRNVVPDPLDASRVALATVANTVRQIRVRADGSFEDLGSTPLGSGYGFALFGGTLVVGRCDEAVPLPLACGVEVIGVAGRAQLPEERVHNDPDARVPAGKVHAIAISPAGNGVAVSDYGAYLFDLQTE